ncbi:MAG: adenylate/guanylate cyclase domain-containing protein [Gemmatimonadota bacterium]|nr:adenylate/guanylate cyclase domain-containing protein [Gemmatimonadota bacterium]
MTGQPLHLEGLTGHGDLLVPGGRPWLVGRGPSADLIIADSAVSRHHAEVEATTEGLRARDLGSANGTFINGARIAEGYLRPGDTLTLGRPAFRLTGPGPAGASAEPDAPRWRTAAVPGGVPDHPDLLKQLLTLARTLSGTFDLEQLCRDIVERMFEVVPADRVALLVVRGPDGALVPVQSRNRIGEDSSVQVPRAIAGRAAASRQAVITASALDDETLRSGSVEASRVRSAIAAPLLADDEQVVGVLYADRIARLEPFSDADAQAVMAFAGLAAVSLAKLELLDAARRREETQRNLERFFAPDVAATIGAATGSLTAGGERRVVTVLFSDIRDFTPLAESLPPEAVAGLLNEYFTVMAELVFSHGGTLDKFLGDGLMAVWGAPLESPDACARAIDAARAMRQAVAELNRAWAARGHPVLGVGYGLARGEAFAGRIGSDHRLDYTVIGDVVNVAARLCKVAQADQILLTEAVRLELPGSASLERHGGSSVRGRAGAIEVWVG